VPGSIKEVKDTYWFAGTMPATYREEIFGLSNDCRKYCTWHVTRSNISKCKYSIPRNVIFWSCPETSFKCL